MIACSGLLACPVGAEPEVRGEFHDGFQIRSMDVILHGTSRDLLRLPGSFEGLQHSLGLSVSMVISDHEFSGR